MGTHLIPRQIDGDARILLIFTPSGFVGVIIGIAIGAFFHTLASAIGAEIVGWFLLAICAGIGFVVGQVKIPESNAFALFRKVGGETIRDIIMRYIAFQKKRKIYLYDRTSLYKEVETKAPKIDKIVNAVAEGPKKDKDDKNNN